MPISRGRVFGPVATLDSSFSFHSVLMTTEEPANITQCFVISQILLSEYLDNSFPDSAVVKRTFML
jgi:hypothetical protein